MSGGPNESETSQEQLYNWNVVVLFIQNTMRPVYLVGYFKAGLSMSS